MVPNDATPCAASCSIILTRQFAGADMIWIMYPFQSAASILADIDETDASDSYVSCMVFQVSFKWWLVPSA